MLNSKSEVNDRDVKIVPRSIDIIFFDQNSPIAIEIPSAEELSEFRIGYELKLSIPEVSQNDVFNLRSQYQDEFKRLVEKFDDKDISKTYLLNLADLAEYSNDNEKAFTYIKRAIELDETNYSKNKLGDNYVNRGLKEDANKYFNSIASSGNGYAHLRTAYFHLLNRNLDGASLHIEQALAIDPLDFKSRLFHGALCLYKGELEKAIRSFKIASEEEPNSSVAKVNLAASYWKLGLHGKAYKSLKRAIVLDPYNENAISFYVDVSHILGKDEECIPILEKFLEFEQKKEHIWGQYARAFYSVGKRKNNKVMLQKALEALRHQESFTSSSGVWNNLGLCKWALGDFHSSEKYLNYSLKKSLENSSNIAVPLYNLCGLMIQNEKHEAFSKVFESCLHLLEPENESLALLEKIKLQHVILTEANSNRKEAVNLAIKYLEDDLADLNVKLDLLVRILYFHTTSEPDLKIVLSVKNEVLLLVKCEDKSLRTDLKERAVNNLAFAYLNFGLIEEVDEFINLMSNSFHIDPFTTATLGMYKIKKGNLEEGVKLYYEAISLLSDQKTKKRFKQRMNFEIGKFYLEHDEPRKSARYLKRALEEKQGFNFVKKEITKLLDE
jgi:tetratricopeptide (TPR) repeat protein